MDEENQAVVLIPSDLAGKPVSAGLARTFLSDVDLKVYTLTNDVITDYSSPRAEQIFREMREMVDEIVKKSKDDATFYLMCSGSVINAVLVLQRLLQHVDETRVKLLVWERTNRRYEIYSVSGEQVFDALAKGD